jgi:hypothetical protein
MPPEPRRDAADRLRGATQRFGAVVALDHVDLEIAVSFAWLAAYGLLLFAVAAWAFRREEGRTFG